MSELKLPAASGGGSISIKGPSSSGSDVDVLDTSGNLAISGTSTLTGNVTASGTLTTTGNVGIGTTSITSPSGHSNLFIGGAANIYAEATGGAGNSFSISQNAHIDSDNSWEYIVTDEASNMYMTGGNTVFRYAASGTGGTDISWSESLRIRSDGKIGIGANSADAKLVVQTQTDGGGAVFKAENNDAGNYGGLLIKGGVVDRECRFQSTSGSSFFTFYTEDGGGNITEKLRILPDGTMRFGMEDFSSSPSTSNYGMSFGNTNNACVWIATSESTSTHIIYANGNGTCGSITTNGTSTAYNTSSDYRLKENIVGITDGITRVKQLAPKRFNFKTKADTVLDGFLAHEVTSIVPEAISGAKDAVEPEDNADKGIKKGDIIPQGIDQTKLVPLLTAALQEAIAKIEVLETKVAALEAG